MITLRNEDRIKVALLFSSHISQDRAKRDLLSLCGKNRPVRRGDATRTVVVWQLCVKRVSLPAIASAISTGTLKGFALYKMYCQSFFYSLLKTLFVYVTNK
jgi:hypothetical protein